MRSQNGSALYSFVVLAVFTAVSIHADEVSIAQKAEIAAQEKRDTESAVRASAGIGTPYGLDFLLSGAIKIGESRRLELGAEAGLEPLLGVSVGVYGQVYLSKDPQNGGLYVKLGQRYLPVLNRSSDMRAISTTSFGVGYETKGGTRFEAAVTQSDRYHRDACNVDNCSPNGTTSRTGVMFSVGRPF